MITPDPRTLLFQLAIFLAVWWGLGRLIIRPLLDSIRAREALGPGALREAERMEREAADLEGDLGRKIEAARAEALRVREEIRARASEEERKTLEIAREEGAGRLRAARAKVAREIEEARREVRAEIPRLARDLAENVLSRRGAA